MAALAKLAEREALRRDAAAGEPVTAREIAGLIAARRARRDAFGIDLMHPGWTLLLQLYLAHLEGQAIRISRLRSVSRLPGATALRWLDRICCEGLAAKRRTESRSRGVIVELTPAGAGAMRDHLQAIKAGWIIA